MSQANVKRSSEQFDLELALNALPRHPEDNSNKTAIDMVEDLPLIPDDILLVVAHEIEIAKLRRRHKSFEGYHEDKRVRLGLPNPIIPDFLEDGMYFRPSPEQLKAIVNAAYEAHRAMEFLRFNRKIQSSMKAEGVVDFEYDEGIL